MDYKELKNEVNRLNSKINKRVRRMIDSGVVSPALRSLAEHRGIDIDSISDKEEIKRLLHFGIDSTDTYQELQKKYWEVYHYGEEATSNLKGTKEYLKNLFKNIGVNKKVSDVMGSLEFSKNFFKLVGKLKEFISQSKTKGKAESLNYNEIFKQVNTFIQDTSIQDALAISNLDLNEIIDNMIAYYNQDSNDEDKDNNFLQDSEWVSI